MPENPVKLYDINTEPSSAFFIESGTVFFSPNTVDCYSVNGRNVIVGATEIIVGLLDGRVPMRIESAAAECGSQIKRISRDSFISNLEVPSFSLNISMVIAKQVLLTNNIISANLSALTCDTDLMKNSAIEYYKIVERLRDEYNKRRYPWLSALVKELELSLTWKKGEAYARSSDPVLVNTASSASERVVEYPRGSVIFEENTPGSEMFILQSGTLEVSIAGRKAAVIEQPGTVIGEMALLLGEKRTATIKPVNTAVLTRITREELKQSAARGGEILSAVLHSLAKRHYFNIIRLHDINEKAVDKALEEEDAPSREAATARRAASELRKMKDRITQAVKGKDTSFLKDLLNSF